MPIITQDTSIEISPERFLNSCSPAELFDVDRLIQQRRYQDKIEQMMTGVISENAEVVTERISPAQAQIAGRAIHGTRTLYRGECTVCHLPTHVRQYQGYDTCEKCITNLKNNC